MAVNPTDYSYLYQVAPGTPTFDAKKLEQELAAAKAKDIAAAAQAQRDAAENARKADMESQYKYADLAETTRAHNLDNNYNMGLLGAKNAAAGLTATIPFATTTSTQNTATYTNERLDKYIANIRGRLGDPDKVKKYLQSTTSLAPGFKQAVLDRFNAHVVSGE